MLWTSIQTTSQSSVTPLIAAGAAHRRCQTLRTASDAAALDTDSDTLIFADVDGPRIQASIATYKVVMK